MVPVYTSICNSSWILVHITYRLMYALFHIRTVIITRNRYRTEGFSPRVNIGRGMITVLIRKKACINLFITYFNIELKRTKLTSHTDTKCMDMSDRYRLRDDNSPDMEKACIDLFIERLDILISEFRWADFAVALPVFTYGQN